MLFRTLILQLCFGVPCIGDDIKVSRFSAFLLIVKKRAAGWRILLVKITAFPVLTACVPLLGKVCEIPILAGDWWKHGICVNELTLQRFNFGIRGSLLLFLFLVMRQETISKIQWSTVSFWTDLCPTDDLTTRDCVLLVTDASLFPFSAPDPWTVFHWLPSRSRKQLVYSTSLRGHSIMLRAWTSSRKLYVH